MFSDVLDHPVHVRISLADVGYHFPSDLKNAHLASRKHDANSMLQGLLGADGGGHSGVEDAPIIGMDAREQLTTSSPGRLTEHRSSPIGALQARPCSRDSIPEFKAPVTEVGESQGGRELRFANPDPAF
jgi:hypothetical protein